MDRRTFLKAGLWGFGASLLGPAQFLRLASAGEAAGDAPTLVVLQLSGGNDGLSMVVPHGDDQYHRVRRQTRIKPEEVLRLTDYVGLNPKLKALEAVFGRGDLAIVQGCSYPNPNRSHFKAMDIWQAADHRGRRAGTGWLGRAMDELYSDDQNPDRYAALGGSVPYALLANEHKPVSLQRPRQYRWAGPKFLDEPFSALNHPSEERHRQERSNRAFLHDIAAAARASSARVRKAWESYQAKARYPAGRLSEGFKLASALVGGRLGTRVIYLPLGGFDTHTTQRGRHDRLMQILGDTLAAFLDDLKVHGRGDKVTVLVFSEFGRRVKENGSGGTDHGVAAPMLLCGAGIAGGIYGRHPSLTDLDHGDLKMTTDFRSVYASILDGWIGVPSQKILGQRFPALHLFGASTAPRLPEGGGATPATVPAPRAPDRKKGPVLF